MVLGETMGHAEAQVIQALAEGPLPPERGRMPRDADAKTRLARKLRSMQ
jgi:hypothetical protein